MNSQKMNQIWDAHVHLFPPEIYKHWEKYAQRDEWFKILTEKPLNGKGTEEAWADVDEAIACADEAGVFGMVMQGWYYNDVEMMRIHNDYMADCIKKYPDRLVAFASINPKFKDKAIEEIERCKKMGFMGIGELGPGGNGYDFNDADFLEVLNYANELKMPVCIHCGEPVGRNYKGKDLTSLAPLPDLISKYKDIQFILAHLGGGLPFYNMLKGYHGKWDNVYYDTAANPLLYHIKSIKLVMEMVGEDHLLFGSDFPLLLYPSKCRTMDMKLFIDDIKKSAGLNPAQSDQFFYKNLKKIIAQNNEA